MVREFFKATRTARTTVQALEECEECEAYGRSPLHVFGSGDVPGNCRVPRRKKAVDLLKPWGPQP